MNENAKKLTMLLGMPMMNASKPTATKKSAPPTKTTKKSTKKKSTKKTTSKKLPPWLGK